VPRDVWRLCELALPFMLLISVCVLTGSYVTEKRQWLEGRARRTLNGTVGYTETPSAFDFNHSAMPRHSAEDAWAKKATDHAFVLLIFALTPLVAAWCIYIMVWSVVSGFVTEYISAFLLVLSVKNSIFAEHSMTTTLAVASAGTCFVLIFLMRKII